MNSIHNNGKTDASLNDDLDKLSRVYGQLQQTEPPELLDQAILNSARRTLEKKPHWINFSWLHGLTTAAVFVLALSLVLNQHEPSPAYENGMGKAESISLQRQKAIMKQSGEQTDELQRVKEMKSQNPSNASQSIPVTVVPARPASETRLETQLMLEELLMDDADFKADTAKAAAVIKPTRIPVISKPTKADLNQRYRTDSDLDQQLLLIIKLKQDGNERWKTELESFKKSYPDYQLPDELQD